MRKTNSPATGRELLWINLWILLAIAFLLNRHRLPVWLLPEYRHMAELVQMHDASVQALRDLMRPDRIRLGHSLTLIAGDSSVCACDWPTDVICFNGATPAQLTERVREQLGALPPRKYGLWRSRSYKEILLWTGTAFLAKEGEIEEYVTSLQNLVTLAAVHAERVVIIGPMPFDLTLPKNPRAEYFRQMPDITWNTYQITEECVASVSDTLPNVPLLDLTPFQANIVQAGRLDELYVDGIHLNEAGCALLQEELRRRGFLAEPT